MLTGDKKRPDGLQVDLTQAETVLCEKCGNVLFIQSFFLKKVSRLVSPTGQETIVPMQVFGCEKCGHVNKEFSDISALQ